MIFGHRKWISEHTSQPEKIEKAYLTHVVLKSIATKQHSEHCSCIHHCIPEQTQHKMEEQWVCSQHLVELYMDHWSITMHTAIMTMWMSDISITTKNKDQKNKKKKGMMQGMNDSLASIQRREHIRSKGLSSWQPAKNIEVYRNCSRMQRRCWRGYKGLQNQTLSEVKSTYCETLCFPYLSYASRFCGSLSIW